MQAGVGVGLHGVQHVASLEGDGFQRGADDVVAVGAAGQAKDGAAGIRIPVGRAQAGEGRHHVDAVAVFHFGGEIFGVGCVADQFQLVAQPLDRRTADEHRAFQRIVHFAAWAAGDGGQQAVFRTHRFFAGVHQQEAAGAVGVLRHARLNAQLAVQCRLLVTGDTGDRNTRAALTADVGLAVHLGGRTDFRQHGARDIQHFQHALVPVQLVDVEHHGT